MRRLNVDFKPIFRTGESAFLNAIYGHLNVYVKGKKT